MCIRDRYSATLSGNFAKAAALAKFPDKVAEYRGGKTGILGLFMGEVMKLSKGKADPKMTSKMLEHKLTIDN